MRSIKITASVLVALLALASCSRNPEVAKRRYLESGNKYFDKGKFKEARIMYKDAIQKDRLFGPAYYRLGLTALELRSLSEAVGAFLRAIELIKPDNPDHWNAIVKLCDIYLPVGRAQNQKQFLDEVENYTKKLLERDPNSFDGHRFKAGLTLAQAVTQFNTAHREEAKQLVNQAIEQFQIANRIKPGNQGVMMQLAGAYTFLEQYDESEKLYRQLIEQNKGYQPYSELYRLLVMQKRMPEGEQLLKDAFKASPKQFNYLAMLANHLVAEGRRDEMAAVLQQIKSHAADYEQAYLVVGDFYLRLGDGDSAIREYREAIGKDVKKKNTYQKRMIEVLMRQGKRNEAADLNAQVLKDDPNDNDAKGLAATFLLDKGDVVHAVSELQAVVTRAPENFVARFNLGRAHAARGDHEQARQMFLKAIESRPDYLPARLALAQLQLGRRDFEAALKTVEQILALDKGNAVARLIESAALIGLRKFAEARTLLDALLKANPTSSEIYYQLGFLNIAENRFKDAEEAFRKSYQLNPANSRGLMGVVETAMLQNKPEMAMQILRAEAEKYPNRADLRIELGNTAARAGHYDAALGEFQKVLNTLDKDSKSRADVLVRIGETQRRKGDHPGAVATFQQASAILPENGAILRALALSHEQSGQYAEAKRVYEAALKIDGNNGITLNNLAFLIAEHGGDLEDALTKAQRAKQIFPNLNEVSDTLGWIYLKKNMSDNAIEIFRDLVAKAPKHPTFRYHLAMAFHQKGDRTRAIKELQEALKNNPPKKEKDEIQSLLSKLGA